MTKKSILFFALVLTLTISMGSFVNTLAQPQLPAETSEAAITKILKVPYGTDIPEDMSFEFTVTAVAEDEGEPTEDMPVIGEKGVVTINIGKSHELEDTVGDVDSYYLESDELFEDVDWPHAGVYEYSIKETSGTYKVNTTPPPTEIIEYSEAEYTVIVYVLENEEGELEISHIAAVKITDDDGEPIQEDEQDKTDPTPGGGNNTENEYSQMIFVNTYVLTNDGTDPKNPDDWTLAIGKKVCGNFSDSSVYFEYTMTVTAPSLLSGNPVYKAYVVKEDPKKPGTYEIDTSPDNGAESGNDYIEFISGTEMKFSLKHGQHLVFLDAPVGLSYTITETGTSGYTPSVTVKYDNTLSEKDNTTGSVGSSLSLPNKVIKSSMLHVSKDGSSADFLNDRGTITPTGLNIKTLPFIGMIILAIMVFAGYILSKHFKYSKHN